jgi:hypothetical protein
LPLLHLDYNTKCELYTNLCLDNGSSYGMEFLWQIVDVVDPCGGFGPNLFYIRGSYSYFAKTLDICVKC